MVFSCSLNSINYFSLLFNSIHICCLLKKMENKKHIFTPIEKKIFTDIIKKHSVIENKETDGASLRRKTEAWQEVTAEYNASPHATSQATTKQLKRLWMNLKQRQREALTRERQYRLATGGGASITDLSIDPDVAQAAPALIVGIDMAIDSDTVLEVNDTLEVPAYPAPSTFNNPTCPPPPATQKIFPKLSQKLSQKDSILEKEYKDRQIRANEKHELEMLILKEQRREASEKHDIELKILEEKHREAKAKADLIEMVREQKQSLSDFPSVATKVNFDT